MTKKKGLGRGLQALIPTMDKDSREENLVMGVLKEIPLSDIDTNPGQPRLLVDEKRLEELVKSISEHGVIQPVVVRSRDNGRYQLIAGERRWRACIQLGMDKIPALVREASDLEASAVALIENIQRENLNPLEEARAYQRLIDQYGLTQDDVSRRVGKSRPFIANMVRLLNLPEEIMDMVNEGLITAGHARALLALPDEEIRRKVAFRVIKKNMTVRQTEEYVREILEGTVKKNKPRKKPDWCKEVKEQFQSFFGARVRISNRGDSGKIVIEYNNQDELKRIVNTISN